MGLKWIVNLKRLVYQFSQSYIPKKNICVIGIILTKEKTCDILAHQTAKDHENLDSWTSN